MGQKVEVSGTGYDLKGGKTLIGGTAYAIKKGRTLIGGTGYDIKLKSEETWLLNTNPKWEGIKTYNINFISNGEAFIGISMDFVLRYIRSADDRIAVCGNGTGWYDQLYRTLIFDEEPTGDLLTWLETNGTRQ